MNTKILKEVSELDSLNNNDLYKLIGQESDNKSFGITGKDDKRLQQRGKNIFRLKLPEIKTILCNNEIFKKLIHNHLNKSRTEIAAVVADILLTEIDIVPVCVISLLIAREYMESLCDDE
ncbi:hypothetical protein QUF50_06090 [Thiotrichales bacterium HSG1]|nr:hypothetical protein [Thiotrichales bacterium HSG1]